MTVPPIIRLLRPHQYAKNLLVFSAPGAAGRLDEASVVGLSIAAFVLFCMVSSAGYIANDLLDAEADRLHPLKRHRPIASGQVSANQAIGTLAVLAIVAFSLAPLISWDFAAVLGGYGTVTLTYSTWLKRVPWLELLAVSAGFVLRAVGGGAATDTALSGWFLLVVSAGALLVITGKRVGEFIVLGAATGSRRVLGGYQLHDLRRLAAVAAMLAVGGYTSWAAAEANNRVVDSTAAALLRLTAFPFAVAIGRYLMLSWRGSGETPESIIVRDRIMLAAGTCWTVVYAIGLYL